MNDSQTKYVAMSIAYAVTSIALFGLMAFSSFGALASGQPDHGNMHSAETGVPFGDPFYLPTCPVLGQKLGAMGKSVVRSHEEREIRFCCAGCVEQFNDNPTKYINSINALMIQDQLQFYPLETCLVTGQKLTAMGKPVDRIYKNRLIRLCCGACVSEFEKDPDQYIQKLDTAVIRQQKMMYPTELCLASGEKLGGAMGEPVDMAIANRLVRLCCQGCVKMVQENPSEYLAILDQLKGAKMHKEDSQAMDHSGHQH